MQGSDQDSLSMGEEGLCLTGLQRGGEPFHSLISWEKKKMMGQSEGGDPFTKVINIGEKGRRLSLQGLEEREA